ncbi:MAG: hypothetical protein HOW73_02035 [Polyangiaceae bacterium]|nr:hypothetical protein [Polyangiaceae bacterium]
MGSIAYVTDLEGSWGKLASFCEGSPLVGLSDAGVLTVAAGARLVFGGDAIDRGPFGRKIVATLLDAKRTQPDQVVLLAGNRDINKLRLVRELRGFPPHRAPRELQTAGQGALLAFIFSHTMGAKDALAHRRTELELEGRPLSDDDVAQSFLDDLEPDGLLTRYLSVCQLSYREGPTLFVHGGVTAENVGADPWHGERAADVDTWVDRLNTFYRDSMAAFVERRMCADGTPGWSELVDYQAPVRGTRNNQGSVVYARTTNDAGHPVLPARSVVDRLLADGIDRVVVGHTPVGDCPALLRDERGFQLVMADNSYGRVDRAPRVHIVDDELYVYGETELDSGERRIVEYELARTERGPLGLVDSSSGALVKAKLREGDYLLYRAVGEYRVEQHAEPASALDQRDLLPPYPG